MRTGVYSIFFLLLVFVTANAQQDSSYYLKAKQAFKQENCKEAIENFTKDLALNPKRTVSLYARALCYRQLGKLDKSVEDLQAILKLDSANVDAMNALGDTYRLRNENKKAIQLFDRALVFDSNAREVYNNRGLAYEALKDYAEAEKNYIQANNFSPDADCYVNLGRTYLKMKQYEKALQAANRAIELNGESKDAYTLRSMAYLELDEFDKSDEDAKKAKSLKQTKKLCDECH
ncbi:MAG: tetratricopeptide repeat protein [Bacteroidetes bacterium]|nr:tetratricopeptide repeat protein [Bacteroidota bacterium]